MDAFFALLFGLPYMIVFLCMAWWYLVTEAWYLLLIPFYIGSIFGIARKDPRWLVIGLVVTWIGSWIVACILMCNTKID